MHLKLARTFMFGSRERERARKRNIKEMGTECVALVHVPKRELTVVGEQPSNKAKKREARRRVADRVPALSGCHNYNIPII